MFKKIIGNPLSKDLIASMISQKRLPHNIILSGDKGLGKFTFAKEIAKQIVFNDTLDDHIIKNCVDINIIDGDINGTISINNIREIKNSINIAPILSDKKVQIIANCDKMTIAAQNALLKSLEEPSISTIFILTSTNIHKLLNTILSRATIIYMRPLSYDQLVNELSNLYPNVKMSYIIRLAKIFDGNLGLAKSILDNQLSKSHLTLCEDLLFYILTQNSFEIMRIFACFKNSRPNFIAFIELFIFYFEKLLKLYFSQKNLSEILKNHHTQYFSSIHNYLFIPDLLLETIELLNSNVNLNLIATWLNTKLTYHH